MIEWKIRENNHKSHICMTDKVYVSLTEEPSPPPSEFFKVNCKVSVTLRDTGTTSRTRISAHNLDQAKRLAIHVAHDLVVGTCRALQESDLPLQEYLNATDLNGEIKYAVN